jgi:hypothetical protein
MPLPSRDEPPTHALDAASFADRLAQEYIKQRGTMHAMFVGFAGLVSARDQKVGADCLIALDRKLFGDGDKQVMSGS